MPRLLVTIRSAGTPALDVARTEVKGGKPRRNRESVRIRRLVRPPRLHWIQPRGAASRLPAPLTSSAHAAGESSSPCHRHTRNKDRKATVPDPSGIPSLASFIDGL